MKRLNAWGAWSAGASGGQGTSTDRGRPGNDPSVARGPEDGASTVVVASRARAGGQIDPVPPGRIGRKAFRWLEVVPMLDAYVPG